MDEISELNLSRDPDGEIGVRATSIGGKPVYELVLPSLILTMNEGQARVLMARIAHALASPVPEWTEEISEDERLLLNRMIAKREMR